MPRPAIVWSVEYDSLAAFEAEASPSAAPGAAVATIENTGPTSDQLLDAHDKARRMIAGDAAVGADCTVAIAMDANGVMSIAVNRKA